MTVGAEAHAPVERAFENGKSPVGSPAEEKQFARLIRCEREAEILFREPVGELARAGEFKARFGTRSHNAIPPKPTRGKKTGRTDALIENERRLFPIRAKSAPSFRSIMAQSSLPMTVPRRNESLFH